MITFLLVVTIWRLTRLLVVDEFPPVKAIRTWVISTFAEVQADGTLGLRPVPLIRRWREPLLSLALLLGALAILTLIGWWAPSLLMWQRVLLGGVGLLFWLAVWICALPTAGLAIAYVWTCAWCMSIWAGAGLVLVADIWLSVQTPALIVAAGSCLAGVMSWVEGEHEQRWRAREADWEGRR